MDIDPYHLGRYLGALFWPLLLAALAFGVGQLIATLRPPNAANAVRAWTRLVTAVVFVATLFLTVGGLLALR